MSTRSHSASKSAEIFLQGVSQRGAFASLALRKQRRHMFLKQKPARLADRFLEFVIASFLFGWVYKEVAAQTLVANLGIYTMHIYDIPTIAIILYCILSIMYIRFVENILFYLFLIPSSILILNGFRGLMGGSAESLNTMRTFFPLVFVPIAAMLCPEPVRLFLRCRRYALVAGGLLALLQFLRMVTHVDLFVLASIPVNELNDGGRPLSSQGATSILVAFWLTFFQPPQERVSGKFWEFAFRVFLFLAVVVSKQGTTTLAALVTLLVYFCISYKPLRAPGLLLLPTTALFAHFGVPLILSAFFDPAWVSHRLDNLGTREAVWTGFTQLFQGQSWLVQAIGWPFGERPTLQVVMGGKSYVWERSLHSMYYGGLSEMGYIGNGVFIATFFGVLVFHLLKFAKFNSRSGLVSAIICVVLFASFYSYEATGPIAVAMLWPLLAMRSRLNGAAEPPHFAQRYAVIHAA